jgi:hypothetical protein
MTNTTPKRSRRGVYYDLTESPYEYNSPYGDLFKFSSEKKLEIYTRDVDKEIKRVNDLFSRHDLKKLVPVEIIDLVRRAVYRSFYNRVER